MWRSVLLGAVLAGALAGCSLGSGSGADSQTASQQSQRLTLTVTLSGSAGGSATHTRVAHLRCPPLAGSIIGPHLLCDRVTSHPGLYFGVPASYVAPLGGSGTLQVRGTMNGVAIVRDYRLGQMPQYPAWVQLLFAPSKHPSGV